jgi:hypothetical protein
VLIPVSRSLCRTTEAESTIAFDVYRGGEGPSGGRSAVRSSVELAAATAPAWVAILGAITGSVALLVNILDRWRDRPALVVGGGDRLSPDGTATLVLSVTNKGRRPVSITGCGYLGHVSTPGPPVPIPGPRRT